MNSKKSIIDLNRPFYLKNNFIILMASLWPLLGIPFIISMILLKKQNAHDKAYLESLHELLEKEVMISMRKTINDAKMEAASIRMQAENELIEISEVNYQIINKQKENQKIYDELVERIALLKEQEAVLISKKIN